jgi:hypothetical protein
VVPEYRSLEFTMVWEADFQFRVGPMLAAVMKAILLEAPLRKILRQWKEWRSWINEGPQSA